MAFRSVSLSLALLGALAGCASHAQPVENHTFFQTDEVLVHGLIEVPYPQLDLPSPHGVAGGGYVGVSVLGGMARFSRPASWQIRRGSSIKGRRFIEYVSPHEYVFGIYERDDDPSGAWGDVLKTYESDVKAADVEWVGKAIPIAGFDTQGREYVLHRKVKGQRAPFVNTSREFMFRGRHEFALVELVHQGKSDAAIEGEVMRTVQTLSVL